MSTNYYIERTDDQHGTAIHVGKYSGGWRFNFSGLECRTVQEWRDRLNNLADNERLVSEYGVPYTAEEFFREVVEGSKTYCGRPAFAYSTRNDERKWTDEGFNFSAYEFH